MLSFYDRGEIATHGKSRQVGLPKSVDKKIPPLRKKREGRLKAKDQARLHETTGFQSVAGGQHDSCEDGNEKRNARKDLDRRPNRSRLKFGGGGGFVGEKHLVLHRMGFDRSS